MAFEPERFVSFRFGMARCFLASRRSGVFELFFAELPLAPPELAPPSPLPLVTVSEAGESDTLRLVFLVFSKNLPDTLLCPRI